MKFYEPFQRLSFVYFKGDANLYVKSSVSVLLPARVSLVGRDTIFNSSFEATLRFYYTINETIREQYTFEQERSIQFLSSKELAMASESKEVDAIISKMITDQLGTYRFCKVTCEIYNESGVKSGQATNTIAQDGEVIII